MNLHILMFCHESCLSCPAVAKAARPDQRGVSTDSQYQEYGMPLPSSHHHGAAISQVPATSEVAITRRALTVQG
jgi:hypothetical protein